MPRALWILVAVVMSVLLAAPAAGSPTRTHDPAPTGARGVEGLSYKYAGTTQYFAPGERPGSLFATFSVHRPDQVRSGQHSLVEMAVAAPGMDYTFVEAGVRTGGGDRPRLFVFWWIDGEPQCYDVGCGFVRQGRGKAPGAALTPGTRIRVGWEHAGGRWWLRVNGKRSGYYPDRLWDGRFRAADRVQLFGEVVAREGQRLCADMGNGRPVDSRRAATVTEVRYPGGPRVALEKTQETPRRDYRIRMLGRDAFRYGGPGAC